MLFIGGTFGRLFGLGVHHGWDVDMDPAYCAFVGAAAFMGACLHKPLLLLHCCLLLCGLTSCPAALDFVSPSLLVTSAALILLPPPLRHAVVWLLRVAFAGGTGRILMFLSVVLLEVRATVQLNKHCQSTISIFRCSCCLACVASLGSVAATRAMLLRRTLCMLCLQ